MQDSPLITFAWCPTTPILATGSYHSKTSQIELFQLSTNLSGTIQKSIGKVNSSSRLSALAWGNSQIAKPWGILAAGTNTGGLELWDPYAISDHDDSNKNAFLSQRTTTHTQSIFYMDFNIHQPNLLVTAGSDNEVFIWDLANNPEIPYTPGAHTPNMDEQLTKVGWNCQVPYILATCFSNGHTSILDLRSKKKVMELTGRYPLSSVAWHPDIATQLVTSSMDDTHSVITLWDLRRANTPEKTMQGHSKGVLDLSWCRQDSELLVSSGKDGKILSWDPRTGSYTDIAESDSSSIQIDFCPRNPNWLASASLGGEINVWSIQHGHRTTSLEGYNPDIILEEQHLPIKQPPKWLRRPVGATFGFGGKLVLFGHHPRSDSQRQEQQSDELTTRKVKLTIISDTDIVQRSSTLEYAKIDHQMLLKFMDEKCQQEYVNNHWRLLRILFMENAREQLISYLGLDKQELLLQKAVNLSTLSPSSPSSSSSPPSPSPISSNINMNTTTKQISTLSGIFRSADIHPPSDIDFFSQTAPPERKTITSDTSIRDSRISRAVAIGDFESAVTLCLEDESRMADALILAVSGGPDLFNRTRRLYLERQAHVSYLHLLDHLVRQDLMTFVQNSHVNDWKLVLAVLCTFATSDEFATLCEALGSRLETASTSAPPTSLYTLPPPDELLQHASICYLASGKLERLLPLWIAELDQHDETDAQNLELQEFIEKVMVFLSAIEFDDPFLTDSGHSDIITTTSTSNKNTRWMDILYSKYCEYAYFLAINGQLDTAFKYLGLVPDSFYGQNGNEGMAIIRDRIYRATSHHGMILLNMDHTSPFGSYHIIRDSSSEQTESVEHQIYQQRRYQQQQYQEQQQQPQRQHHHPQQQQYQQQQQEQQQQQYHHHQQQQKQPQQQHQQQQQQHQLLFHRPSLDILQPQHQYLAKDRGNDRYAKDSNADALFMTARDIPFFDPPTNSETTPPLRQETHFFDSYTPQTDSPTTLHNTVDTSTEAIKSTYLDMQSLSATSPITLQNRDTEGFDYFEKQQRQNYQKQRPQYTDTPTSGPPTAQHLWTQHIWGTNKEQQQQQKSPPYPSPQRNHQKTTSPQYQGTQGGKAHQHHVENSDIFSSAETQDEKSSPRFRTSPHNPSNQLHRSPQGNMPEKRRYPKEDRSHIKPEHEPIYQILSQASPQSRHRMEHGQRKYWEDTDKRLGYLFEQLNNDDVSDSVAQSLLELVQAFSNGRYEQALNIQMNLVTTKYDECSSWLLAVKRIIEYGRQGA
ncbi:uncharacterized protein BX664DRAFT_335738 [Halteromyces radiatus]|uniref:uncharacterized protein n=1 Tax=Halteromyces radiatus TaxID=101107 RepID=UPI00222010B1|nr:uncharacterized protein BX664DRAFT_335738 [Halteromyces radiatus]KAI8086415.1 hypothetical protein BX664DRAFT_335738 [Halteromyces radiatus]